jgi:hypothetical protein
VDLTTKTSACRKRAGLLQTEKTDCLRSSLSGSGEMLIKNREKVLFYDLVCELKVHQPVAMGSENKI